MKSENRGPNLVAIADRSITVNGQAVTASVNPDNGMELVIPLALTAYTEYTVEVPVIVVTGSHGETEHQCRNNVFDCLHRVKFVFRVRSEKPDTELTDSGDTG